jgi:hypothetical protein
MLGLPFALGKQRRFSVNERARQGSARRIAQVCEKASMAKIHDETLSRVQSQFGAR